MDDWGFSAIKPSASWYTYMETGMFGALANYASNKLNKLDEFNKENVWRLAEMLYKLCSGSVHYLNGNIDFQNCFETTKIDKISHDFNYDKKEEIKEMCDKVEKG